CPRSQRPLDWRIAVLPRALLLVLIHERDERGGIVWDDFQRAPQGRGSGRRPPRHCQGKTEIAPALVEAWRRRDGTLIDLDRFGNAMSVGEGEAEIVQRIGVSALDLDGTAAGPDGSLRIP